MFLTTWVCIYIYSEKYIYARVLTDTVQRIRTYRYVTHDVQKLGYDSFGTRNDANGLNVKILDRTRNQTLFISLSCYVNWYRYIFSRDACNRDETDFLDYFSLFEIPFRSPRVIFDRETTSRNVARCFPYTLVFK